MDNSKLRVLCCNVRGLNSSARRDAVHDLVRDFAAMVVCLQEFKIHAVDRQCIIETLGFDFADDFAFLPASGTRGA